MFERAAIDASWIVYCQARVDTNGDGRIAAQIGASGGFEGDLLTRYLAHADRERPIDELLATHQVLPWLVVSAGGSVTLLDLARGLEVNLSERGARLPPNPEAYLEHPWVVFHPKQALLAYASKGRDPITVTLLDLESSVEQVLGLGSGALQRLRFDASGRNLLVELSTTTTTWPSTRSGQGASGAQSCRRFAPIPEVSVGPEPAGRSLTVVVNSGHENDRWVPNLPLAGFIAQMAEGALVRSEDKSLWLLGGRKRTLVADAKCAGVVWHVDEERSCIAFACARENPVSLTKLQLFSGGQVKSLDVELRPLGPDRRFGQGRLVPFYPGAHTALFDVDEQSVTLLEPGDAIAAAFENWALIWRAGRIMSWDADRKALEEVARRADKLPHWVTNGPMTVVTPYVLDARLKTPVGKVSGRPLAVSRDGRVLVAQGSSRSPESLDLGPLRWVRPEAEKSPVGSYSGLGPPSPVR